MAQKKMLRQDLRAATAPRGKLAPGVWSHPLDTETLENFGKKTPPACPNPMGMHTKGNKATCVLSRADGRILTYACGVDAQATADAWASESEDL